MQVNHGMPLTIEFQEWLQESTMPLSRLWPRQRSQDAAIEFEASEIMMENRRYNELMKRKTIDSDLCSRMQFHTFTACELHKAMAWMRSVGMSGYADEYDYV